MLDEQEVLEGEAVEVDEAGAEIALREQTIEHERAVSRPPASVLPSPVEWEATMAVARQIAATPFVPESYRGNPESVVAAILTGREMGIGPMQALRQIHMIDGRPAFAADLMLAKMRQGGVQILDSEATAERASIKARRRDTGEECEVEWTLADAEKAGLLGKKNYKTYPSDMMWARCVGRLARRLGSDLLGGLVYAAEEMADFSEGGYGGPGGYDATTVRPFDPETDLLPGAISGEGAPQRIVQALEGIDPTVDWPQVIADVVSKTWAVHGWRELGEEERPEFWRRLSNAAEKIRQETGTGDFPPVDVPQIQAGFAFAFSGTVVDVTYKPVEEAPIAAEVADAAIAAADESLPFGYERE